VVPNATVDAEPRELAEQEVVVDLLHRLVLGADTVERLLCTALHRCAHEFGRTSRGRLRGGDTPGDGQPGTPAAAMNPNALHVVSAATPIWGCCAQLVRAVSASPHPEVSGKCRRGDKVPLRLLADGADSGATLGAFRRRTRNRRQDIFGLFAEARQMFDFY
jgi:hypothetical protein